MAEDWKKKRNRDEDEDETTRELNLYKGAQQRKEGAPAQAKSGEKYDELLERAQPMIEQLNNLYNQYVSGAERLPPLERRKQLDQIMSSLQISPKPTPAAQFRFQTIWTQYKTYADRWDKLMKDLETGKIKRNIGGR